MQEIMTGTATFIATLLLTLFLVGPAVAEAPKSPFGVPLPSQSAQSAPSAQQGSPSLLQRTWAWILAEQQRVNRELAAAIKKMKSGSMLEGTLVLAFLSFMYGVLHAAGPGHGKAVISSYVLANERTVRRGILLSFLAAGIQALSAIVIVGVLAILLNATSLQIRSAEAWIETASWGLVAAVGLWLLWGQVKAIKTRWRNRVQQGHSHAQFRPLPEGHRHPEPLHEHAGCCGHHDTHGHDHAHSHGHSGHGGHKASQTLTTHAHAHEHSEGHHHKHGHHHDHDGACCDHAHIPDPSQLEGDFSWRKALAIAFSVGIRPCTGAILVMIFALSQGIFLAGVFSTFAMALGTALTVSVLAALALGSRELAERVAGRESGWGSAVASGAGLLGSSLVFAMGVSFFLASLNGGGAPL